jgi:hypothetical protein
MELSSDTLPPYLCDNLVHLSRSCNSNLSSVVRAHRSAMQPNEPSPMALSSPSYRRSVPRIMPLLSAALKHNSCEPAEAFQGLFAFVFVFVHGFHLMFLAATVHATTFHFILINFHAYSVIVGEAKTMEFNAFTAVCTHLMEQQVKRD